METSARSGSRPYVFFARGRAAFFLAPPVGGAVFFARVPVRAPVRLRPVPRGAVVGSAGEPAPSVDVTSLEDAGDASSASRAAGVMSASKGSGSGAVGG